MLSFSNLMRILRLALSSQEANQPVASVDQWLMLLMIMEKSELNIIGINTTVHRISPAGRDDSLILPNLNSKVIKIKLKFLVPILQ